MSKKEPFTEQFLKDYENHANNNNCIDRVTLAQHGPTCWFNAIMTVLFYSDGMRELIKKNLSDKSYYSPAHEQIKKILNDYFIHTDPDDPEETYINAQDVLNLNLLLKNLYNEDPSKFVFNPDTHTGFKSRLYIHKMLEYLNIKDYLYLETNELEETDETNRALYLSCYNYITNIDKVKNKSSKIKTRDLNEFEALPDKLRTPQVLFILISEKESKSICDEYETLQTFELAEIITYKNIKYKLDSMILSNFNDKECKLGHSIAGITCNGGRYLYNGWIDQTSDKSKPENLDNMFAKIPCSFIMHDWMDKSKDDFCLNPRTCFINPIQDRLDKQVCFSYNKGDRHYIYIRIDDDIKTASAEGGSGPKQKAIRKAIPKAIRQHFRIPTNLRVSEVPEWMARTYSKAELTSMIGLPTKERRSFSRLTKEKMIVMILRLGGPS